MDDAHRGAAGVDGPDAKQLPAHCTEMWPAVGPATEVCATVQLVHKIVAWNQAQQQKETDGDPSSSGAGPEIRVPAAARLAPRFALRAARALAATVRNAGPMDIAMNATQGVLVLRQVAGSVNETWEQRAAWLKGVQLQRQVAAAAVGMDHTAVALARMPAVGLSPSWRMGRDNRYGRERGERDPPAEASWGAERRKAGDTQRMDGTYDVTGSIARAIGGAIVSCANSLATGGPADRTCAPLQWASSSTSSGSHCGRPLTALVDTLVPLQPAVNSR